MFSLSMQKYFLERYSILERIGVGLALLLLIIVISQRAVSRLYVSLPLAALTVVMGLSLFQLRAAFMLSDYVAYVFIGVYAIVLVSAFSGRVAVNGLVVALSILLVVNTVSAVQTPSVLFGPLPLLGTFYGPNTLAASIVVLLPAVLAVNFWSKPSTYVLRLLFLAASLWVVSLTHATTELFSIFVLLATWAAFVFLPKLSRAVRTAVWVLLATALLLGIFLWPTLLAARGKSTDLSGRGEIWSAYLDKILERPIFGYGWAVQTTPEMPLGEYISRVIGSHIHNAHDDFINWWAHTGIFGALLYLLSLVTLFGLGIRLRKENHPITMWAAVTAVTFGVNGVAEMTSFFPDGWMVLALVSTSVSVVASQTSADGRLKHNWGYRSFQFARISSQGQFAK